MLLIILCEPICLFKRIMLSNTAYPEEKCIKTPIPNVGYEKNVWSPLTTLKVRPSQTYIPQAFEKYFESRREYFPSFLVFCFSGFLRSVFPLLWFDYLSLCGYGIVYSGILGDGTKVSVAILNGITKGGGAGISIPGTFRLATYKTVFATLETLIGFHPDARASFYLPRLPGHLGLTGEKLSGEEMVACGVSTHYSHSSRLQSIEKQLWKLVTDDPSVLETTLGKYGEVVYPEKGVLSRIEMIDKCFSHDTVEEIIEAGHATIISDQGSPSWSTTWVQRDDPFQGPAPSSTSNSPSDLDYTSANRNLSKRLSTTNDRPAHHGDQARIPEYTLNVEPIDGISPSTASFTEITVTRPQTAYHFVLRSPTSLRGVTSKTCSQTKVRTHSPSARHTATSSLRNLHLKE
ncbi:hypothetical protein UlMin_002842 [Ulmus minor]